MFKAPSSEKEKYFVMMNKLSNRVPNTRIERFVYCSAAQGSAYGTLYHVQNVQDLSRHKIKITKRDPLFAGKYRPHHEWYSLKTIQQMES